MTPLLLALALSAPETVARATPEDAGLTGGGEQRPDDTPHGPGAANGANLVVGGEPAAGGVWPDAVAVFYGDNFGCSGVLIAPDLVLTAGHCSAGPTHVLLGTTDLRAGGEIIPVETVIPHEDSWSTYDVALLRLATPSTVPPRPLALDCIAEDFVDEGADVTIVGFGATDLFASEWTSQLMQADTQVTDAECRDELTGCNMAVSPGGEIVAGGGGVDSCNGDSGGPLYLRTPYGTWLAGITSRAAAPLTTPCGDGGIYVRADAVADWIEEVAAVTLARPPCDAYNRAPEPVGRVLEVRPLTTAHAQLDAADPNPDDGHTWRIASPPEHGTASVSAEGDVAYAPWGGPETAPLPDSFEVEVTDDGDPPLSARSVVKVVPVARAAAPVTGCDTAGSPASPWLAAAAAVALARRASARRPARR